MPGINIICQTCKKILLDFYDFRKVCLKSNKVIQQSIEHLRTEPAGDIQKLKLLKTPQPTSETVKVSSDQASESLPQVKSELLSCPIDECERIFRKQDRMEAHIREHEGKKVIFFTSIQLPITAQRPSKNFKLTLSTFLIAARDLSEMR